MNNWRILFHGEKIFKANTFEQAEEIAEKYLKEISNPLNAKVYSINVLDTKGD